MSSEGAPIRRKIVILGDGEVGKTSLMRRYLQEGFDRSEPDMPVHRSVEISMELDGRIVIMTVWDLLGREGYDPMNPSGLYGSAGIIIVADLTRLSTLRSVETRWAPWVRQEVGHTPIVVVGNKADLTDDWAYGDTELEETASRFGAHHIRTSAKTGMNVTAAYELMTRAVLTRLGMESSIWTGDGKPFEVTNLTDAVYALVGDFCKRHGHRDKALDLAMEAMDRVGLSIEAPTIEGLEEFAAALGSLYQQRWGDEDAEVYAQNREQILSWVRGARSMDREMERG